MRERTSPRVHRGRLAVGGLPSLPGLREVIYLGTGDCVITQDVDSGWVNMGTYRVQVHSRNETGLYISPGKHGRLHRDRHFERGEALPAVVLCGMDPLLFIASALEMAPGLSELEWVGGMRGRPLECIRGRRTGLQGPRQHQ